MRCYTWYKGRKAELKPCPFCGRIPTVDDCGDNRFFVRCKCGIVQDKLYGQKCDAVRRWNARRQQPVIRGVIDESGRIKFIGQPEPKTGKWINNIHDIPICSQCGYMTPYDRAIDDYEYGNFCPNCGARMEVEK